MSVFTRDEHWKICRKYADRLLDKVDVEDRAGIATRETAKSFYVASDYYSILQKFYALGKEGDG